MRTLTLYTRAGCHLCEEMKAVVEAAARRRPISLCEVDVAADPRLEQQYGDQVPVLMLEGRKIAKYRIGLDDLLRRLERDG